MPNAALFALVLAQQDAADSVLEKLEPPRRAAVMMALLGIVLLGLFLAICIMIGARWVRRLGPREELARRDSRQRNEQRATGAEVAPGTPNGATSETLAGDQRSDDTLRES